MSSRFPHLTAWYRRCLALYPSPFRDRYREELLDTFRRRAAHVAARGRLPLLGFVARAFAELAPSAVRVRLGQPRLPVGPRPRTRWSDFMRSVWQDVVYAVRTMRRTPGVTAVALITLALGIGATTAIYSVIDAVLFHPLSAPRPERLMIVSESSEARPYLPVSYDNFRDWQRLATSFEALSAFRSQSVAVTGGGKPPERIRGLFVSGSFFRTLGEAPGLGRAIAEGEDIPGGPRTAVLSYGFWQRRYGGDSTVIGQPITLNNYSHTIVGVMGKGFRFPYDETEAWISLQTYPGALNRSNATLAILGRLAPGVTVEQAGADMRRVSAQLAEGYAVNRGRSSTLTPVTQVLVGDESTRLLTILLAAVAMVLLIGAANVANLQLARATGREREMAIRLAIGGRRRRLIRQLLTENLVLAGAGGALGLLVAGGGVRLLVHHGPGWIGGRFATAIHPGILGFVAVVTLLTSIIFGLAPTLRASRVDLRDAMQESGPSQTGRRGQRFRSSLVAVQMALAVMLLVGAGLLLRSLSRLQAVDVGFDRDNLLTMQFRLPRNKYDTDEKVIAFFDEMLRRVRAVSGVIDAASAQSMPFTGDGGSVPFLKDGVDPGEGVDPPRVAVNLVSNNYFAVLRIPVLKGHVFTPADRAGTEPVVVVSQGIADRFYPREDLLGRTVRVRGDTTRFTIIGVVGDIKDRGLVAEAAPTFYASQEQFPTRFATIGIRVPNNPTTYVAPVRDAIWAIDADQPLWEIMTQNERIGYWTSSEEFSTWLMSIFSALALVLAAVGIAGIIAYSVGTRTHEFGIRMALGARQPAILGLVMRQGAVVLGAGIVVGILGAAALSRALAGILYGVSTTDAVAFLAAPAVLLVVALVACYLPARRAARVDPSTALRHE